MLKRLENILQNEIDPVFSKRAAFIFDEIKKIMPKKVLDAGCGRGFYINSLTNFDFIEEIHGVDIVDKYLKIAKKNSLDNRIKIRKADIYSLPYPNNYFDVIVCSEVLEHLAWDKKALFELKRVLKPSGTLLITVPNLNFPFLWDPINWILMKLFNKHINKNIWWLAGIWADHERLYTINRLESLIKSVGFSIKKKLFIMHRVLPFSHFLLYGIGKNLVERFGFQSFSRFNKDTKRPFIQFLATVFALPDKLFGKNPTLDDQSVGIGIVATLNK